MKSDMIQYGMFDQIKTIREIIAAKKIDKIYPKGQDQI